MSVKLKFSNMRKGIFIDMKAVLIVEGVHDADQIHKAFEGNDNVKTLVTEGTKVNNRIIAEIENCIREGYKPYILSDPDEAGLRLAEMVQESYPDIPRLEVDLMECSYFTGKKFKGGIEYASYEYLKELIYPLIGKKYTRKQYPICWD